MSSLISIPSNKFSFLVLQKSVAVITLLVLQVTTDISYYHRVVAGLKLKKMWPKANNSNKNGGYINNSQQNKVTDLLNKLQQNINNLQQQKQHNLVDNRATQVLQRQQSCKRNQDAERQAIENERKVEVRKGLVEVEKTLQMDFLVYFFSSWNTRLERVLLQNIIQEQMISSHDITNLFRNWVPLCMINDENNTNHELLHAVEYEGVEQKDPIMKLMSTKEKVETSNKKDEIEMSMKSPIMKLVLNKMKEEYRNEFFQAQQYEESTSKQRGHQIKHDEEEAVLRRYVVNIDHNKNANVNRYKSDFMNISTFFTEVHSGLSTQKINFNKKPTNFRAFQKLVDESKSQNLLVVEDKNYNKYDNDNNIKNQDYNHIKQLAQERNKPLVIDEQQEEGKEESKEQMEFHDKRSHSKKSVNEEFHEDNINYEEHNRKFDQLMIQGIFKQDHEIDALFDVKKRSNVPDLNFKVVGHNVWKPHNEALYNSIPLLDIRAHLVFKALIYTLEYDRDDQFRVVTTPDKLFGVKIEKINADNN